MDLTDLFIGMSTKQKQKQEIQTITVTRFPLDVSFQVVRRLFVLIFDNTGGGAKKVERNSHTKYFLPRANITNYNILIDGKNFYDQLINDMIKQYNEIRKIET